MREHEKHSEVAFVQSGIFRSFYTTAAGNDMTYCFRFPNEFVAAYSSFITGDESTESIQAISPAAILVIEKSTINRLELENPKWSVFLKIMAEQQFLELEKRVFQLQEKHLRSVTATCSIISRNWYGKFRCSIWLLIWELPSGI